MGIPAFQEINIFLFIYLYSGFGTIANCHQPLILAIATGK